MKKQNLLFNIIITILIIFIIGLFIEFNRKMQPIELKPNKEQIIVYDKTADGTTVKAKNINKPQSLNIDINNYPCYEELTNIFIIYDMFNIDYNIEDYYLKYFDVSETAQDVQGKASPEILGLINNLYFKDQNLKISCKDLYYTDLSNLYKIAQNKGPILAGYSETYNGDPDYAWQYINSIIIFSTDENMIVYKDLNGNQISVNKDTFYKQGLKCGGFALVFGNFR